MKKGFEILFTGLDGSGKTTLLNLVKEYLEVKGKKVVIIKAVPLGKNWDKFDNSILDTSIPEVKFMLHLTQHLDIYHNQTRPAINKGKIVLRDRGIVDLFVYNSLFKLREFGGLLNHINDDFIEGFDIPRLIFYMETKLSIIKKRLEERGEKVNVRELSKVKRLFEEVYLDMVVVNSNRSIEEMFEVAKNALKMEGIC